MVNEVGAAAWHAHGGAATVYDIEAHSTQPFTPFLLHQLNIIPTSASLFCLPPSKRGGDWSDAQLSQIATLLVLQLDHIHPEQSSAGTTKLRKR